MTEDTELVQVWLSPMELSAIKGMLDGQISNMTNMTQALESLKVMRQRLDNPSEDAPNKPIREDNRQRKEPFGEKPYDRGWDPETGE